MKRTIKLTLMTMLCSLALLFAVPSFSIPASAATAPDSGTVQPQADVIYWVFKDEGGTTYRRLYNSSTGEWLGEWEPVVGKGVNPPNPGRHEHP